MQENGQSRYAQLRNPITENWIKVDIKSGNIVSHQKKQYKGIPIYVNKYNWEEKNILENEGLKDWKVIISKGGGLCMKSTKTIYCLKNDKALFLHEVAHAITPKSKDKTGHDSIWADKYTELVRKYLTK